MQVTVTYLGVPVVAVDAGVVRTPAGAIAMGLGGGLGGYAAYRAGGRAAAEALELHDDAHGELIPTTALRLARLPFGRRVVVFARFRDALAGVPARRGARARGGTAASLFIVPALVSGIACQLQPVDTVPPPVSPTAAIQYYDLEVPRDLDIKAVDFSATTFSDVSGTQGTTSSAVGGRAFVKVYAVHRTTGEQFLLLYEDIAHRKRPVQVIRFRRGPDRAQPDSTR